ncbi:serine/threonine-protein kinase WNK2-like isoform X2 [Anopheles albimanus]|uniref:serine/threonine-protein kinase WNK2-like isoform X2 n=1 Tax=Anopheles albimanus TaxID=7167 RepID=UPI00163EADF8|nr:serine/threonine-protein kinase WNK2-like isoform X2 [Anopheles albimanus]
MKVFAAVLLMVAVTRGQLIDPYTNEGLLPYNGWPQQPLLQNLLNPYAVYPFQQLPPVPIAPQPYPLLPTGQQLPPVPVPFPAQYPLPGQLQPTVNYQLPLPQQPSYQQMQAPLQPPVTTGASGASTGSQPQPATVQTSPVNSATVPVTPAISPAAVKDIATFGTEYGTGADKSPVARYEAINAGSVHVAPLPGHTVDQKLIAPGTAEQKAI